MAPNVDLTRALNLLTQRVAALEQWRGTISTVITGLASRVTDLEAGDSVDVSAIETRLSTLEHQTCPHENSTDPTTFASRIRLLEAAENNSGALS